jgi:membrane protease YdiL (CAAX protease family)
MECKLEKIKNFFCYDHYRNLTLSQKWKLIFYVVIVDCVGVLIIAILFLSFYGLNIDAALADLKISHPNFFKSSFKDFSWVLFNRPLAEEYSFRIYLYALVWYISRKITVRNVEYENFVNYILWISLVVPTAFWAFNGHYMATTVFFAGMTWGWLIIKTKRIWPAVVAHSIDNLIFVIVIKLFQNLEIIKPGISSPREINNIQDTTIDMTNNLIQIITAYN